MDSKIEKVETTTLVLNVEEREWLKALVQNAINHFAGTSAYNESEEDKIMRNKFWTALGGATMRGDS